MAKQIKSIFDKSYIVKAQAEKAALKEFGENWAVSCELFIRPDVMPSRWAVREMATDAGSAIPKILENVDHSISAARLINAFVQIAAFKIAAAKYPQACTICPQCGSDELFQGRAPDGKTIDEDSYGGCYQCDWEFDLKAQAKADKIANATMGKGVAPQRLSSVDKPVKRVWHIADSMPMASRKDVMAECVRQGVAYGTARTQYQAWFKASQDAKREDIRKPFAKSE